MEHTFTEIADTLAVDRSAVIVDVSHQELAEVFDDGPSDAIVGDPLDDRFRLDVAELLQGHFLFQSIRGGREKKYPHDGQRGQEEEK